MKSGLNPVASEPSGHWMWSYWTLIQWIQVRVVVLGEVVVAASSSGYSGFKIRVSNNFRNPTCSYSFRSESTGLATNFNDVQANREYAPGSVIIPARMDNNPGWFSKKLHLFRSHDASV